MSDQIKELPVNMFNWALCDKEKCVISEDNKSADGKQIIWGLKTIVLGAQSGTQNC